MAATAYTSRIINIGGVPLGGPHPVRVQSMTTTNTMDTVATVEQSIRMIEAGCEYVRITAPGVREAENLKNIKKELLNRGYTTPLIADIHYQPKAALIAARHVEKVRINPGNYVDRKKGRPHFTDAEYEVELEKASDRLKPLIDVCKKEGTAIRIGTNHGSLSERILFRYGDTPLGMVESTLEFVKLCEALGFQDLVLSLKASNVKVMVHANRLLVERMVALGMDYPIHLGVTEAGDAEDGRMKSAAGIGPLLLEGIGDTIRVSLTEEPEKEITVARNLLLLTQEFIKPEHPSIHHSDKTEYSRRISSPFGAFGKGRPPAVVLDAFDLKKDAHFEEDRLPDFIYDAGELSAYSPKEPPEHKIPVVNINSLEELRDKPDLLKGNEIIHFQDPQSHQPQELITWFRELQKQSNLYPVLVTYQSADADKEKLLLKATVYLSVLLLEGLPDAIRIRNKKLSPAVLADLSYGILQATGARISKTEFIACPSCGRTLFDIQSTLQVIKKRCGHLKGLKIGVMGCCVNGPGEMADADYGYVGAGRGKITLYRGKKIMKIGIREEDAVDELVRLIKDSGDWK
jgi:(E)-4-hydroxy-3-methylbut-2-enyl-diphosphate synthase